MTPDAHLLVEIRDGIAVSTMNRPERMNALSEAMIASRAKELLFLSELLQAQQGLEFGLPNRVLLSRSGARGGTADHHEGVAAFVEKRAPKFTGR